MDYILRSLNQMTLSKQVKTGRKYSQYISEKGLKSECFEKSHKWIRKRQLKKPTKTWKSHHKRRYPNKHLKMWLKDDSNGAARNCNRITLEYYLISTNGASLVAQWVKNLPEMQETWFSSWVGKIPWRRGRLPTPVFLGFPGSSRW